ncbi:hypothetical protein ABID23_000965 [Bartonella silvatica]|uniref:Uncharacterized protein n=1 Tax=Bartonella silvatica TaxID=357760 RepID=A0ABV2HHK7_9HYPH
MGGIFCDQWRGVLPMVWGVMVQTLRVRGC